MRLKITSLTFVSQIARHTNQMQGPTAWRKSSNDLCSANLAQVFKRVLRLHYIACTYNYQSFIR